MTEKQRWLSRYDVIIVGSGTAGGTLFSELSILWPGLQVLLIEAGGVVKDGEDGQFWPFFLKHYRNFVLLSRSPSTVIYAGAMVGGTSVISCGNMNRNSVLEEAFRDRGVELSSYLGRAEKMLGVKPLASNKIIGGSKILVQASQQTGFKLLPMPKAVEASCDGCGDCVMGCHKKAKWDVRPGIELAQSSNYHLLPNTTVRKVVFDNRGRAIGVDLGWGRKIDAPIVVLATSGLGTPKILLNSGVKNEAIGCGLSIHPFEVTYGRKKGQTQQKGMSMAAFCKPEEGIVISPFIDQRSQKELACGPAWSLQNPLPEVLGLMVKVKDPESDGRVYGNGWISYSVPPEARQRLKRGAEMAREILLAADVDPKTITTTSMFPRGAHPSCTAKLGKVVDSSLEVFGHRGLFISDSSAIPLSTGTPPILTLVGLNLYLAERLSKKF